VVSAYSMHDPSCCFWFLFPSLFEFIVNPRGANGCLWMKSKKAFQFFLWNGKNDGIINFFCGTVKMMGSSILSLKTDLLPTALTPTTYFLTT
jgi:hypothetical protein